MGLPPCTEVLGAPVHIIDVENVLRHPSGSWSGSDVGVLRALEPKGIHQLFLRRHGRNSHLNDFLKNDAARYQEQHLSCTQLAPLDSVIVGYLTMLADCIILKTGEKRNLFNFHQSIYTFSALKIGRIGVQKELQVKNRIGTQLLKYVISLAIRLNQDLHIGCRFITLDAYPKSISWYEKNGFVFNKHYSSPEKTHPSMRFDIVKSTMIS